jgi:hypothetical protein
MVKDFDCVKMKWELQEKLYKQLKPVSIDDYFRKLKQLRQKAPLWNQLISRH